MSEPSHARTSVNPVLRDARTWARHWQGYLPGHVTIVGAIVCFWLTSEGRGTSAPLRADCLTPLPAPAPPSCTTCPSR